jgi:predicted GNAT family N-acyltransferase
MSVKPSLTIKRAATQADLVRCLRIRRAVFTLEKHVPPEIEVDEQDALNSSCDHFLLQYRGEDVGALRCMHLSPAADTVKLQRFCIYADQRGRGLGRAAMAAIEDYYRAHGKRKLDLDAKFEVCGFYESCGYQKISEIFLEAGIEHVKMTKNL